MARELLALLAPRPVSREEFLAIRVAALAPLAAETAPRVACVPRERLAPNGSSWVADDTREVLRSLEQRLAEALQHCAALEQAQHHWQADLAELGNKLRATEESLRASERRVLSVSAETRRAGEGTVACLAWVG